MGRSVPVGMACGPCAPCAQHGGVASATAHQVVAGGSMLCTVNLSGFPLSVAFHRSAHLRRVLASLSLAACGSGEPAPTQVLHVRSGNPGSSGHGPARGCTDVPVPTAPPATTGPRGRKPLLPSRPWRRPRFRPRRLRPARPWLPRRFWLRMPSASSSVPARDVPADALGLRRR